MDIPVRFKFFDKLKLYQDYLKQDSMLEKNKSEYWLYEKCILFWAYSPRHQHIGRPLDADVFCVDSERLHILPTIARRLSTDSGSISWLEENVTSKPAAIHAIANLNTLGLVKTVSIYKNGDDIDTVFLDFPKKVYVNQKGFLLGELLFETYENPSFLSKDYRKYKLTLFTFHTAFIALFLTIFLVFFDLLFRFIKPAVIAVTVKELYGFFWWSPVLTIFVLFLGFRKLWKNL